MDRLYVNGWVTPVAPEESPDTTAVYRPVYAVFMFDSFTELRDFARPATSPVGSNTFTQYESVNSDGLVTVIDT